MPKRLTDRTLEFVDLVYECAANPAGWGRFASELSKECGNAAVVLLLSSGWEERDDRIFWVGLEPNPAFFAFRDQDPWMPACKSSKVGELVVHREPSAEQIAANAYYREFLAPQGFGAGPIVTILLEQQPSSQVEGILGVIPRADGPRLQHRELELLRALAPHLVRARSLCLAIDRGRARHGGLSEVLDRLQIGVILADDKARPVFANRSAGELLGVEEGASGSRRLDRVREALGRLSGVLRIGADDTGSGVVLVRSPVDGAPLQLIVSRIERGDSLLGYDVTNAIFLADPRRAAGHPVSVLRALYGLTPAEAQLTLLLSAGLSVEEAARRLRVTIGTARTRLGRIFEKTNTHRQVELVRLVLAGAGQLLGSGRRPPE